MMEIEAKIRVQDLESVRKTLQNTGADFIGQFVETNYIFDRLDGSLRAQGCGLRVRGMETIKGRPASATLTYKGKIQPGPVKKREEIEVEISDPDDTLALLRALGFETLLSYRKARESWSLDDCRIELDELPLIGTFIEIEGPTETAVQKTHQKLGLQDKPHEPKSYVAMLVDQCRSKGRSTIGVGFQ